MGYRTVIVSPELAFRRGRVDTGHRLSHRRVAGFRIDIPLNTTGHATCPPHFFKTIDRLDHGVSSLNFGISRELPSNFVNRIARDSSDHCSTN
ncbi:MAG: hypothetical protein M3P38_08995 [Chloroflexota bacterium]|nr:hypothetical protein [Chloroflexota bacterium]